MKRGFTLVEVVVSIAIIAILASTIYYILSFLNSYQIDKVDRWKAYKLVENVHAEYLNDPTSFYDNQLLYFDKNLNETTENKAYFIMQYNISVQDDVYEMYIVKITRKNGSVLIDNVTLGKWVIPNEA